MVESKSIPADDLKIIRQMDKKLEAFTTLHSRKRREFLAIEAGLLREIGILERDFKVFFFDLAKELGLEESEMHLWTLNMERGELTKELPDPPEEEPIIEDTPPPDPTKDKINLIRQKYGV